MVAYDYSAEPNNPWDMATWNPRAQIDFTRRMRSAWNFNGTAQKRIEQRIAQSDTKGVPPMPVKKQSPFQVIVQKRILAPNVHNVTLGFGLAGPVTAMTQWTLPVISERITFPSGTTASEARCDSAPTETVTLTLSDAFNNVLCVVTFAAGSTVGTFDWSGVPVGYIAQPGDLFYLFADEPADATFGGVNLAFIGSSVPT